jgi:hypothetical protein
MSIKQNLNVTNPIKFSEKLQEVMSGIYELFEVTKERNLSSVSDDGVIRYTEEGGKTCFQVSGQYERPSEFLQTLLDIVRVNFEPCVMGTFFLNSNMYFLYDEIPTSSFQLGYASIASEDNQSFSLFWSEKVIPYLEDCGYDIENSTAMYAVASTGKERYGIEFVQEIATTLGSGFSVNEAMDLLASSINPCMTQPRKQTYSGYCLDSELGSSIRLSLWFFIQNKTDEIRD